MEVSKVSRWWSQKTRGNSLNRSQGSGLKSQGGGLKSLIAVSIVPGGGLNRSQDSGLKSQDGGLKSLIAVSIVPGGGLNSLRVVVSVVAGAVYIVPVVSQ